MPTILTARDSHDCWRCGREIRPGDSFIMQMTDRYQRLPTCLACAGVKDGVAVGKFHACLQPDDVAKIAAILDSEGYEIRQCENNLDFEVWK